MWTGRRSRSTCAKDPRRRPITRRPFLRIRACQSSVLEEAIYQIGERVVSDGALGVGKDKADPVARSLLLALPPRLRSGSFVSGPGESAVDFSVRIAGDLDETVLAIQGPPGSGKTFSWCEDDLCVD